MGLETTFSDQEKNVPDALALQLREAFTKMMGVLHKQKGASLEIGLLKDPESVKFINRHAEVLNSALDNSGISGVTRRSMENANKIFSGIKTFHELNEAFPSLIDEKGNRKPFEQFLNDVRKVDETYNKTYLKAEYNMVAQASIMAAKWDRFVAEGDRYDLQYRTVGDERVREEHRELNRITLPVTSTFWDSYFPPNGWGCRCGVIQVLKGKYPHSDEQDAITKGEAATEGKGEMFRFNPGKKRSAWTDYNPYTIKDCTTCRTKAFDLAFIPANQLCQACAIVREMNGTYKSLPSHYGGVRISSRHGKTEAKDNIRIATFLADRFNQEVDLLPRCNGKSPDAYNRTLNILQEFKTNHVASYNAIDLAVKEASRQAGNVVLWVESDISIGLLSRAIESRTRRSGRVLSVAVILQGKHASYTREQILEKGWKIKREDLK